MPVLARLAGAAWRPEACRTAARALSAAAPSSAAGNVPASKSTWRGASGTRHPRLPRGGGGAPVHARSTSLADSSPLHRALLRAPSADAILSLFDAQEAEFDMLTTSSALMRLAKVMKTKPHAVATRVPDARLDRLVDLALANVTKRWGCRELSNTVWACAKIGGLAAAQPLLERIAPVALKKTTSFSAADLSKMAWGYAMAGVAAPELFHEFALDAAAQVRGFKANALAAVLWACAVQGERAETLFALAAPRLAQSEDKMATLDPLGLSSVVWAYAKAEHDAPVLFQVIAEAALPKLGAFSAKELVDVLWAYSTAGVPAVDALALFQAIAAEVPAKIKTFDPQDLTGVAKAFSMSGIEAPQLYDAVAAEAVHKMKRFTPRQLAVTLRAFATANAPAPQLFDAAADFAAPKAAEFTARLLGDVSWAFTTAGVAAPALFDAIAAERVRAGRQAIQAEFIEWKPPN